MALRTRVPQIAAAAAAAVLATACAHKRPPPMADALPPPPAADRSPANEPPPPRGDREMGGPAMGAAAPGSTQDFEQNAGDRIYFAYDQYAVTPEAGAVLDRQVGWLQRYGAVKVRIEGNADERGTREYNLALSERRAEAIKRYLVEHGVEGARVTTIAYGKERPIDTTGTEDGMAKNRNGHTTVLEAAR